MTVQVEKFRRLLQDELVRRCHANPSYSLRAFARSLGTDFSVLSKIIRGERRPGVRAITGLSERLGLSAREISDFIVSNPDRTAPEVSEYLQIQEDTFRLLSEWYYYAILELVQVRGFKHDARWIGRKLGLTVGEVTVALERLTRLQMISEVTPGTYAVVVGKTTSIAPDAGPGSKAHRDFQRKILEKAAQALDAVNPEHRSQTSMTFAGNKEKIAEAKSKIKEFRRDLAEFMRGESAVKDEVFCLSVSLFPMTIQNEFH